MIGVLAGGSNTIVATAAQTEDLSMIYPVSRYRQPQGRELVMAGVTDIAGIDMGRRFTAGDGAIVTGKTITREGRMVRRDTHGAKPVRRVMTNIALIGGYDMGSGFTGSGNAVMAAAAGTQSLGMIHGRSCHRGPGDKIEMA